MRGAQVLQRVVRRDREVALFRAHAMAEVGGAIATGVPVPLVAVHDRPLLVLRGAELDVVEDEELGLWAKVGGIGDAALLEMRLSLARDIARIARIRRARARQAA